MADTNSHGNVSLREAVYRSLRTQGGLQLLREPSLFLGCVLDVVDPHAQTTRVLRRNCDEAFLRPFVEGADAGTAQALHDAAMRATGILVQDRLMQPAVSEQVACEISFALCNFVGVFPTDHVRIVATQGVRAGGSSQSSAGQLTPLSSTQGSSGKTNQYQPAGQQASSANPHYTKGPDPIPANPTQSGGRTPSQGMQSSKDSKQQVSQSGQLPVHYSEDISIRERQAEERGIKLRYWGWLKFVCLISAAYRVFSCVSCIQVVADSSTLSQYPSVGILYAVDALVFAGLAVFYAMSWFRLSRFRKNGPSTFLATTGVDTVVPVVLSFVILQSLDSIDGSSAMTLLVPCGIYACLWFVRRSYLNKRAELFTL